MNDISEQRPDFFEGEFLSAADLEQLVVYLRDQSARHALGSHTWGIVAGLQLLEQTAPGGAVDVYLLPGYAVDGYGRAIVVVNPLRLSVDQFNGQLSGQVQVWIRYDQGQTSAVRPGFQICCNGGENYSRVSESYALEVGNLSLATQQSGISISGEAVADARTALRTFNDAGQIICDASVPYQDLPLPDDTKSHWLIPLGQVGWQSGTPGNFVTLVDDSDPGKVILSRRLRRYAGLVTENLYAQDGLIRLRGRTADVAGTVTQKVVDTACAPGDLANAAHDNDFTICGVDGPLPNALVWIEGRLRVNADTRIVSPGRLELRDKDNNDYYAAAGQPSVPLFLQRADRKTGSTNNADLQIVLGKAPDGSNNKLLVQQAGDPQLPTAPCAPVQFDTPKTRFAVLDSGNIGIGTDSPDELLELQAAAPAFVHIKDTADASDFYAGADVHGGVIAVTGGNDLRIRTGGSDPSSGESDPTKDDFARVTVLSTGQVGIGTFDPDKNRALTVQATSQASILVRTDDLKHEGLVRANSSGTTVASMTGDDDLVLSAGGDGGIMWVKAAGRVGINIDTPSHELSVHGTSQSEIAAEKIGGTNRKLLMGADGGGTFIGSATTDDFELRTDGVARATIKTSTGYVGINADSPNHHLEVHGNIALGASGQYFAAGGRGNWAIIAGNVDGGGSPSTGPGYKVSFDFAGRYIIQFTPDTYSNAPIISVTVLDSTVAVPIIVSSDGGGFLLALSNFSSLVHTPFSFMALGNRPT
jgi:hypothetical protein